MEKSIIVARFGNRERQSPQREETTMRTYGNYSTSHNVKEAQSSLYRSQNKSIVVTMVWLIGLATVALAVVVMASEMGLF